MTAPDVVAIARGLSKAQRELLMMFTGVWQTSSNTLYRRHGYYPTPAQSSAITRGAKAIPDLVEKGHHMVGSLGGTGIRLTPLGLAVRAHLAAEGGE